MIVILGFLFLVTYVPISSVVANSDTIVSTNNKPESQLVFSTVLWRHGDRTPTASYPNDPYGDLSFWPVGWGQLTVTGKRQHYALGTWLRKRYLNSVLCERYNESCIYIRSSDVDRTLMSAYSNLAALFPPAKSDQFNENLPWQPIPVHTTPTRLEELFGRQINESPCDAYNHHLNDSVVVEWNNRWLSENRDLLEYLSKHSGSNIDSISKVSALYDVLFIQTVNNKRLPDWATKVLPGKGKLNGQFKRLAAQSFLIETLTPQLARLSYGPLLKEILERLESKANGTLVPNRSLQVYSGHDATIAGLLNMLGLFDGLPPPYASVVLLELRKSHNNNYDVQIFYRNSTAVDEPEPLYIPHCGRSCPLQKLVKLYDHLLPTRSIAEECRWPQHN